MKLKVYDRWFCKRLKVKKIKMCVGGCGELAKNSQSKYCLDCSHKRAVANNSKQSLRRYHKKKGI